MAATAANHHLPRPTREAIDHAMINRWYEVSGNGTCGGFRCGMAAVFCLWMVESGWT